MAAPKSVVLDSGWRPRYHVEPPLSDEAIAEEWIKTQCGISLGWKVLIAVAYVVSACACIIVYLTLA